MSEQVGLVGVGLLGSAIARRLLRAGHGVLGFDVDPERLRGLEADGGTGAQTLSEVASRCERTVLCLPTSGHVSDVVEALSTELAPGALLVDTTTGAPDEVEAMGARLAERSVGYVDATVAGSSAQVDAGEAVAMVGGTAENFERSRDLLEAFSARVVHTGPLGSGSRTKLVVNLVLGLNRAVLAEGLAFAERMGLDLAATLQVLEAGPAASTVMQTKGRKMLDRDYAPQARLAQHLKDVRLILDAARESDARVPLSELHERLLVQAVEAGFGEADNSAVRECFG